MQRNDAKYDSEFIETVIRKIEIEYDNDERWFVYVTDAGPLYSKFKRTVPFDVPVKIEIRIIKGNGRSFFLKVAGWR